MRIQTKEEIFISIVQAILIFIGTLIGNKIIIKLLGVGKDTSLKEKLSQEKNVRVGIINSTELKVLLIQWGVITIRSIFLPNNYAVIIDIVTSIILYKRLLRLTIEKAILAEEINYIVRVFALLVIKPEYIVWGMRSILGIEQNVQLEVETEAIMSGYLIMLIVTVIVRTVLYGIMKYSKRVRRIEIGEFLQNSIKVKMLFIEITSLSIVMITSAVLTSNSGRMRGYLYYQMSLIIMLFFIISIYYVISLAKKDSDEKTIENLEEGNKRLQSNYDNVRSFRHDFNNIMQGIGGYIAVNDMSGLKQMYSSIVGECEEITINQAINSEVINNPAIYSLINDKIRLAQKDGVSLKINVYIDLNTLNISTYDLCRMLGIFIDNAIESAKVCEDKSVYIKFIRDKLNNRNLVIVENPYKNYLIDIKKIYEKGISSKKDKVMHGLGLWRVKQILRKNKNVLIYTSREKMFKQQLEIY